MSEYFKLTGLEDVLEKMRNMGPKLIKSGAKRAVRKGAVVVQKQAQANARRIDDPTTAKSIPDNIAVQYSGPLSKREGGVAYRVGVLGGARATYANNRANRRKGIVGQATSGKAGATWYWRLIELGFTHKQSGKQIRPQPFMVPALVSSIDKATSVILQELGPALDRALEKGR